MTKFISEFNVTLKTLHHHIPALKVLMNIPFCGGQTIRTDVTQHLMRTIERMVYRTDRMLRSLWAHNCCDAHARCIYTLTKQLPEIKKAFDTFDVCNLIEPFSKFLLSVAQTIEKLHFTMSTEILKKEDKHCFFSCLNAEFDSLTACTAQLVNTVNQPTQEFPKWDTLTSSCRNDCDFLPDLYEDLVINVRLCLTAMLNKLKNQDTSIILDIRDGIQFMKSSLEDTCQMIQEYTAKHGALCQSCQSQAIILAIEQIFIELDIACKQMKLFTQIPLAQCMQQINEKSSRLINACIGYVDDETRPIHVQDSLHRDQIDSICRQVALTNEAMAALAAHLSIKVDFPDIKYS
jgi:hypothetical protein